MKKCNINVLNDLCLCTKHKYAFSHLYNATPYYSNIKIYVIKSI